eukprot:scaffold64335_cov65-Phaeocystis_antarctica.AAC.4
MGPFSHVKIDCLPLMLWALKYSSTRIRAMLSSGVMHGTVAACLDRSALPSVNDARCTDT